MTVYAKLYGFQIVASNEIKQEEITPVSEETAISPMANTKCVRKFSKKNFNER